MPKIKGTHHDTYSIDSVGKTYTFAKSYRGRVEDGRAITEGGSNNKIVLHGIVEANDGGYYEISSGGVGVTIRIMSDGIVRGSGKGIYCSGADASVINAGRISGSYSVYLGGSDAEFINRGKVHSEYDAVIIKEDGARVVNEKGGLLKSGNITVSLGGAAGDTFELVNHGKIESDEAAVSGSDSDDTVINDGKITGDIWLGAGTDMVDTRGGRIAGTIHGGAGDDTLITDKADHKLSESAGQGFDTVKSTVTYTLTANVEKLVLLGTKNIDGKGTAGNDTLVGNSGNNVLWGYEGNDRLDGKAGNDILRGGADADTFVFKTGYDKDTIVLFNDGLDKVDVSGWKAVKNFNDLINNHASNHGDDVWIVAGKDRLIIEDTQKTDLDAGDFVF